MAQVPCYALFMTAHQPASPASPQRRPLDAYREGRKAALRDMYVRGLDPDELTANMWSAPEFGRFEFGRFEWVAFDPATDPF